MFRPEGAAVVLLVLGLVGIGPLVQAQEAESSAAEAKQAEREAMYYRYLEFASYVKGGTIEPHWMADGSSFWYAEGAPANTIIWKVDPKANPSAGLRASTKKPLFDTARLRQALTPLLGHAPPYQGLPFEKFTFVDTSEKAVKFMVEDKELILQLDTYTITRVPALSEEEKSRLVPQIVQRAFPQTWADVMEVLSPDGRWFAGFRDYNLYLRSTYDGRRVQLTTDGVEDYEWGYGRVTRRPGPWIKWSPNSLKLAAKKVDTRKVAKILVVHWLNPPEEVEWFHKALTGGPIGQTELFIVDVLSKRQVRVDTGEDPDHYIYVLRWRPDGSELFFLRTDRLSRKLDLMAADPATGSTRVVVTETQKTFVKTHRGNYTRVFTPLEDGKKLIWMSERDGWNHLYLYDIEGNLIRRLTEGSFPVSGRNNERWLVAVYEKAGWVYFTAYGDRQRPYDTHLYRVNLEGNGLTRLTEATGRHAIQFSPSKEFFLDTHSTPTRPPVVELRRADGTLLQILSKGNIDALEEELKWSPPEEFVVKAADGETDLYGVLYKPYDFDPSKKYPVIEVIYAGPGGNTVSHTFTPYSFSGVWAQALAQLGFVTFVVDARGTPKRGKEFWDVVYGNYGRHEIPDHVATLQQLTAQRPYMDLARVGIFGGSAGGYFTLRAMLLAPDVYHVGIADAPAADLYYWAHIYEPYMGLPETNKEGYEYASNLRLAGNLKGKLLMTIGTSDVNVPFSETMKMVEALIRAGKPYDLIVFPEQNHGLPFVPGKVGAYFSEAIRRYFQEHLKP